MRTARLLPLLTTVMALLIAMTLPSGAGAATKRCGRGTVPAQVGKRQACVPRGVAVPDSTDLRPRLSAFLKTDVSRYATARIRRRVGEGAFRRARAFARRLAAGRSVDRLVSGAAPAKAARATARAAETGPAPVDLGHGITATATLEDLLGGRRDDEFGSATPAFTADAMDKGHGIGMKLGGGGGAFAQKCPDVNGDLGLRGAGSFTSGNTVVGRHGFRLVQSVSIRSASFGKAHVGDDAHLRDYDVTFNINVVVDLRVLGPAGLVHGDVVHVENQVEAVYVGLKPDMSFAERDAHLRSLVFAGTKTPLPLYVFGTSLASFEQALADASDWYDRDARCLTLDYAPDVPRQSDPSKTYNVGAYVVAATDHRRVAMDVTAHTDSPTDGTVTPAHATTSETAPASFTWTVGSDPDHWPLLGLTGTSRRGRLQAGFGTQILKPDPAFPAKLRILAASIHTTVTASRATGICAPVGGIHGTSDFSGSSSTAYDADENVVVADRTGVHGQAGAPVPAQWQDDFTGCRSNGDGTVSGCHTTRTQTPQPDGRWNVGATVRAASPTAGEAELHWAILGPAVGPTYTADALCNVGGLSQEIPYDDLTQRIPLTWLTDRQPHVVTFTLPQEQWGTDTLGLPATISLAGTASLTIQKVG